MKVWDYYYVQIDGESMVIDRERRKRKKKEENRKLAFPGVVFFCVCVRVFTRLRSSSAIRKQNYPR